MSKEIRLTQGKVTVVDDKDYEQLNRHKWCAAKNGNTFYAVRGMRKGSKYTAISMHQEILKPSAGMETDHRDGDGLSNQRYNLRAATRTQNLRNQRKRKGTISKYKGVYWDRRRTKWYAQITVTGKPIHIGLFDSEIEAAKTYDAAARKYFGEFAKTNF